MSKGRLTKLEKQYILANSDMKIDDLAAQIGRSRDIVLKVLLSEKPSKSVESIESVEQPQRKFNNKFVDSGESENYYKDNPNMVTPKVTKLTPRNRPKAELDYRRCIKCQRKFLFDPDISADDTGNKCEYCFIRKR